MFNIFKNKKPPEIQAETPLTAEADKFIDTALAEYHPKQEAMESEWRVSSHTEFEMDPDSGQFSITLSDGTSWRADAQILGTFHDEDQTWQWAWSNPDRAEVVSRDSLMVKEVGQRLGICYLVWGIHRVPHAKAVDYLCAIGVKASGATGIFLSQDGPLTMFFTLKNLRWTQ